MEILCINRRGYPTETGDEVIVTVVLVQGDGPDYAAYAGVGTPEYIAARGTKVRFDEAIIHFPTGLKRELYRE